MQLPYEADLIRFFTTKNKVNIKIKNIDMQDKYYTELINKDANNLNNDQMLRIHKKWDKIAFAYKINPIWQKLYTCKTGKFSENYIPNPLHYYFTEYKLINFEYLRAFTDKNYLALLFNDIKQPSTVIRCIQGIFYQDDYATISIEEAVSFIKAEAVNGIVIKPTISSWGGRNIAFFKEKLSEERIKQVISNYGKNFIVQRILKQHKDLSAIHSNSVNTIRIITLLMNGEVCVLSACLRMGVGNNQVDNFSQGGIGCGINKDGRLNKVGYDRNGNRVEKHPNGFNFEDCVVPNFRKVVSEVKKAALRVPQFGVASWDFVVDEEGEPVLIEYNVGRGGIDIHQYNNGPLYGDKTDQIIDYVFNNYHFEDTTLQYNYLVFRDHITISNASKDMKIIWIKNTHHCLPVTRIGDRAFENAKVKYIILPKGLLHIDYCAFYNCKELSYIKFPKGLLTIGRSAFNGCEKLKNIKLPDSVSSIGRYAFKGIKDIEIYIPSTVNSIDDNAFYDCKNVKIYGSKGSYVEKYAKERKYKFIVK